MNSVVERDWTEQERFGKDLLEFENSMRTCSRSMRASIEEARGSIQADNATAALDYIIQLLDAIDASLPGIAEFGARQKKLAYSIRDAEDTNFTRH